MEELERMNTCPNCGTAISQGSTRCTSCGAPHCDSCGAPTRLASKFCGKCGSQLGNFFAKAIARRERKKQERKKRELTQEERQKSFQELLDWIENSSKNTSDPRNYLGFVFEPNSTYIWRQVESGMIEYEWVKIPGRQGCPSSLPMKKKKVMKHLWDTVEYNNTQLDNVSENLRKNELTDKDRAMQRDR